MGDHLDIDVIHDQGVTTLAVQGELDPSTVPELDQAVEAALSKEGLDQVLIDLAGVAFIDSSGLSALLDAHNHGQEQGIQVLVTRPSQQCERLLSATNLAHLLADQ